jgi:hypothetical protein
MPKIPWHPYDWPDNDVPVGGFTAMPGARHVKTMATWVTKGNNCPACNVLKGRTYPLGYWQATVMPGFHEHCDCRLVLAQVGVEESPHDLWGSDPYWWDNSMSPGEYMISMLNRFLAFFNGRQEWWKLDGDLYSGFDNLYPIFMSKSGWTNAPWTLMDYKIRVFGYASVNASYKSLLDTNKRVTDVCLPWETTNKAIPNPNLDKFIRARNR